VSNPSFANYELPAPVFGEVAAEYARVMGTLDAATSSDEAIAVVEKWDALRRRLVSWSTLTHIRFQQDTRNEAYRKAREMRDELEPRLTGLAVEMKRRLLESPHRGAIEQRFGSYVFALWRNDVASFDPAIESDLVAQSKLEKQYTELLASASFDFQGETLTLGEITKFGEHLDGKVRHGADRLRWAWFNKNREELDAIFDELVKLRQTMAKKLGYENFIGVGYQRTQRTSYTQADVERFRAEVRELVVPLSTQLRRRQAERLGVDPLMFWDEGLYDPAGNPTPLGDDGWMIEQAGTMFARLDPQMHDLYVRMRDGQLMDLSTREGKGGGGFCDIVPSFGVPFIFASFNGTKQDVMIFTHEMGHAFQCFSSLDQPLWERVYPPCETTCEIHSMALELLTWPQMELFFGEDAERFRRQHLTSRLLFLPYGAAVDHFQHLVYANPAATPDDRAAMWQEMERTYLPTRNWGDLAHPASGRFWHTQLHIYRFPFYYIDYALALTVALQLWERAASDRPLAMEKYHQLCRRGGEAPFDKLVKSAGLISPFEEGCLATVLEHAQGKLDRMA
jgi:M3 family oligoendopeptidase